MALPDFVQEVITYLTDGDGTHENWNTSNFDPQPTLIDGDEWRDDADDDRVRGVELTEANAIVVDSSPVGTNTPVGTEYDRSVRRGVHVTIEGIHEDAQGQITDKDDFDSLVAEALNAILSERTFPGTTSMKDLFIEEESDESPTGVVRGNTQEIESVNHFQYEFDVWFEGFEDLPD